jgi:urea transporter
MLPQNLISGMNSSSSKIELVQSWRLGHSGHVLLAILLEGVLMLNDMCLLFYELVDSSSSCSMCDRVV